MHVVCRHYLAVFLGAFGTHDGGSQVCSGDWTVRLLRVWFLSAMNLRMIGSWSGRRTGELKCELLQQNNWITKSLCGEIRSRVVVLVDKLNCGIKRETSVCGLVSRNFGSKLSKLLEIYSALVTHISRQQTLSIYTIQTDL